MLTPLYQRNKIKIIKKCGFITTKCADTQALTIEIDKCKRGPKPTDVQTLLVRLQSGPITLENSVMYSRQVKCS